MTRNSFAIRNDDYHKMAEFMRTYNDLIKTISPGILNFIREYERTVSAIIPVITPVIIQMNQFMEQISPVVLATARMYSNFISEIQPVILQAATTMSKIVNDSTLFVSTFTELQNKYWSNEEEAFEKDLENISDIERFEIEQDIVSISFKENNWQQNFMVVIEKWKEKNPIAAKLLFYIVTAVLVPLVIAISTKMPQKTINQTVVREAPQINSSIIIEIKQNQQINVINEVPYYYEIEFIDSVSGKTFSGWISKRSVKPCTEGDLRGDAQ